MKGKSYPVAEGTFIQGDMVRFWDEDRWRKEFFALREVGMEYLVLMGITHSDGSGNQAIYPAGLPGFQFQAGAPDAVDLCLKEAQEAGFKVFLGQNFHQDWWGKGAKDPHWLFQQMERANAVADDLYGRYRDKYPESFYGWYWEYEIDNLNFKTKSELNILVKALNINIWHLEKKEERLPLLLSPFMNKRYSRPAEYAACWEYILAHTGLGKDDVLCLQDSVGAGGIGLPDLPDWFAVLGKAVRAKPGLSFWANTESFEHTDWSSAPLKRFIRQMELVKPWVEKILTFSYSHYYSPHNINEGFHTTYKEYFLTGRLEDQKPTPPSFVRVRRKSSRDFTISWGHAQDNYGIMGYLLYRNRDLVFKTVQQRKYGGQKEGPVHQYTDRVTFPGGLWRPLYEVRALDFTGNLSDPIPALWN